MGGGMAKNLVQKGHDVVAYDVCQDAVCIPLKRGLGEHADKLVQVGTPAEVAAQTRVMHVTYISIKPTDIKDKNYLIYLVIHIMQHHIICSDIGHYAAQQRSCP